jgi:hypothetical protein
MVRYAHAMAASLLDTRRNRAERVGASPVISLKMR